jgi:hypothetical protein
MDERKHNDDVERDPGAYVGREPEFEAETIPGGITRADERVAAYDSRPGVPQEPEEPDARSSEDG